MHFIRQVTTAQSSIITEFSNVSSMIKQRCLPQIRSTGRSGSGRLWHNKSSAAFALCHTRQNLYARSAASFRFNGFLPHSASYYDVNKSLIHSSMNMISAGVPSDCIGCGDEDNNSHDSTLSHGVIKLRLCLF